MKSIAAREAKNGFGHLIDMARLEPVTVEKHGRPVVVVLSVEEFERLKLLEPATLSQPKRVGKGPK
ncbi:MAG: type II toxin-antitoxin system Phd/YefM family antitoxin [Hyphomicrobiaceae bacterium]|nr:type II toxin-antitoxin system Phd/YefM family antitoxin [Hyphomicrobiaceae bacterium]